MKLFWFGILGLLVQGVGLAAFMLVSRFSDATLGKITVVVVTGLAFCTLLWEGVRRSKRILTVCALPFLLTLSYVVAIHLLGVLGFPGLLKDAWPPWLDYFLSVLYVSGILLAIYGLATLLFFAVNRGVRRIRLHGHQQSPKLS
ncbi:MAG: hypothetical protein WCC31_03395 [Terracidiphilus sp.]